ncbi:DUF3267 domain-containing protein [Haladaptatus sp. NG-SE-30]
MLAFFSAVLFVASAFGFGVLLWYGQGAPDEIRVGTDLVEIALGVGVVLATLIVHEAIHGLVFYLLGYRVSFGFAPHIPALYTAAFDQFVTRRDDLLVELTPLVGITVVAIPLLAGPPVVASVAYLALLVNTSGAVGDIHLAWRLWRMPPETVFYDVDIEHGYVFEPTSDTVIIGQRLDGNQ